MHAPLGDNDVVSVETVVGRLAVHEISHGNVVIDPVNGATEVKLFLDSPDLVMFICREDLSWVSHCHPTNGNNNSGFDNRIDLHHSVDSNLCSSADTTSGKQRSACGDKGPIVHRAAVDVRVRPNHNGCSEYDRMTCATSN